MTRPPVDIVVPFVGSDERLHELLAHLRAIRRAPGDTLTVVDNRASHPAGSSAPAEVLRVPERQSSYYARNCGAARGSAPWLVFLDDDVQAEPDIIERYFETEPADRTGMLAGTIEPVLPPGGGRVARYGILRGHLGSEGVSTPGHEYVLTANVAVRRAAFDAVGGFADGVRSGGDADVSFRLHDAGWALERRPGARVSHPTRGSLKSLLRVFARYGAGAQWLRERYPDFAPPAPLARQLVSVAATAVRVPLLAARGRRDDALGRALDPLVGLAFELGRFLPNERDANAAGRLRALWRAARDRWGGR